jgi:hypothetical protein
MAVMLLKTQVYLYYGRAIASEASLEADPTGYQNALTNPSGNKWFFLNAAAIGCLVIYFFTISWIFGLIAIANFFLMMMIANIFYAKPSSPKHLKKIINEMNNRKVAYLKQGDQIRASAVDMLLEKLIVMKNTGDDSLRE